MSVTLVADAGAANANSYCTEAEATTYHATRGFNDAWTDADKTEREKALMWATRLLDQQAWRGIQTTREGSLRWPRSGLVSREGYLVDYTTVPVVIKEACAEWAFYLLGEDRTLDEGGLVQYHGKVGTITDPGMYARKVMPDGVRDMIAPYLIGATGMGRVTRV